MINKPGRMAGDNSMRQPKEYSWEKKPDGRLTNAIDTDKSLRGLDKLNKIGGGMH